YKRLDQVRAAQKPARLKGEVLDADTGKSVAARVYVQAEGGQYYTVQSADPKGSAVAYRKQRAEPGSVEVHTTLGPHGFTVDLPPGKYTVTAERGKEYHPQAKQ